MEGSMSSSDKQPVGLHDDKSRGERATDGAPDVGVSASGELSQREIEFFFLGTWAWLVISHICDWMDILICFCLSISVLWFSQTLWMFCTSLLPCSEQYNNERVISICLMIFDICLSTLWVTTYSLPRYFIMLLFIRSRFVSIRPKGEFVRDWQLMKPKKCQEVSKKVSFQ